MRTVGFVLTVAGLLVAGAFADDETFSQTVSFTNDLEPDQTVTLPGFDTLGGTRILQLVTLDVLHAGSVIAKADNDDPLRSATVNARIIRGFSVAGVEDAAYTALGQKTEISPSVELAEDDGDGDVLDPTPPDGYQFDLWYVGEAAIGIADRPLMPYEGVAEVNFVVSPDTMVNDLQFEGETPSEWQMGIQEPLLEVDVAVTYTWIPEPASSSLVALGVLFLRRRR